MCPCHVLQWIDLVYLDIELVFDHHLEQLVRVTFELVSCANVVEQCGSRDFDVLGAESPIRPEYVSTVTSSSSYPGQYVAPAVQ